PFRIEIAAPGHVAPARDADAHLACHGRFVPERPPARGALLRLVASRRGGRGQRRNGLEEACLSTVSSEPLSRPSGSRHQTVSIIRAGQCVSIPSSYPGSNPFPNPPTSCCRANWSAWSAPTAAASPT